MKHKRNTGSSTPDRRGMTRARQNSPNRSVRLKDIRPYDDVGLLFFFWVCEADDLSNRNIMESKMETLQTVGQLI